MMWPGMTAMHRTGLEWLHKIWGKNMRKDGELQLCGNMEGVLKVTTPASALRLVTTIEECRRYSLIYMRRPP